MFSGFFLKIAAKIQKNIETTNVSVLILPGSSSSSFFFCVLVFSLLSTPFFFIISILLNQNNNTSMKTRVVTILTKILMLERERERVERNPLGNANIFATSFCGKITVLFLFPSHASKDTNAAEFSSIFFSPACSSMPYVRCSFNRKTSFSKS